MDKQKEEEIIKKALEDPEEFTPLFRKYYDKIFRYAAHRTGNAEAARDIAAEAFYRAYKSLPRYRFGSFTFSAFLYKIAGNETINYFRGRKRAPGSLNGETEKNGIISFEERKGLKSELYSVQEEMENNADFMAVNAAMKNIPQKYQEVIALRFLEEKSISEISEILNKKSGTVKSLISRGMGLLKKITKE